MHFTLAITFTFILQQMDRLSTFRIYRDFFHHELQTECTLFESEYPGCCCSVAQLRLTLRDPIDCSTLGFPVLHSLLDFAQLHVHWVSGGISLCHPLPPSLLPPSIFPSIRVFSNESALCIRWPKYGSFSFSTSPSNEYSGLISFRMDWFDLLTVQWTLKSLLQNHN